MTPSTSEKRSLLRRAPSLIRVGVWKRPISMVVRPVSVAEKSRNAARVIRPSRSSSNLRKTVSGSSRTTESRVRLIRSMKAWTFSSEMSASE